MKNKEILTDEIKYIIELIDKYTKNYFNGDFENCNQNFLSLVQPLIRIIEKNEINEHFNEILSKTLSAFEKKDWVLLNDILVYSIRKELIINA